MSPDVGLDDSTVGGVRPLEIQRADRHAIRAVLGSLSHPRPVVGDPGHRDVRPPAAATSAPTIVDCDGTPTRAAPAPTPPGGARPAGPADGWMSGLSCCSRPLPGTVSTPLGS